MTQIKIEDLVQQKDEIKSSLENLSKLKEKEEKERVQKEISDKLNKLKKEIEAYETVDDTEKNKLDTLKSDVDRISNELKKFEIELKSLEQWVRSSQQSVSTESEKKDKWWRDSTKEFVSEQWSNVTSWEKWSEEPWKNFTRAFGFLATWVGIGMWVYSLWNWAFWKKKKKTETEEKSFWDKPVWKFFKWAGIGVWAGTFWYWLGKKLGWIHSDEITDKAKDQAEETVKLKEKDPEKFEKYKWMWENIDSQYSQIMKKEIDAWWNGMSIADWYEKYADKHNIDKDTFQATVPMTIDSQFSDVANFLSEWWYYAYLRGLKFNDLKSEILGWWKEKIGKILGPYLSWLASFVPFKWKDWSEAINDWFQSWDSAERESELKLFFRQYAKVLNYTQDKLHLLKEKIAEAKFQNTWYSTVSDALNDNEWVEEYVYTDPRYKNFINWKLYQSIDVMKDNGIFDDSLSHDMEMVKAASDAERDTILNLKDWKDAIQRLNEAWTNLTAEHYKEWVKCCEKITEDIEDEFDKTRSYLYFWATHEAFNSKTNNIQEFLKHSWLAEVKAWLKVSINEFKQRFANWNITQEEIALYKNQVNSYFAMKKEILIWAKAIQKMKSDNPNFAERVLNVWTAVISDLLNQTCASLKHFKNWEYFSAWVAATIPLYLWWKVLSMAGKYKNSPKIEELWNFIKKSNIFSVVWESKWLVMRRYSKDLNGLPKFLLKARYNISHWDQLLLQDLIDWRISWDKATKLIDKWNKNWVNLREKRAWSISEFIQKLLWKDSVSMPSNYIDILFNNKENIMFMRNPTLRKMFFWDPKSSFLEKGGSYIRKWFCKKTYNTSEFGKVEALEEFVIWKWWNSSIFETLSKEQKIFAKEILEVGNFKTIEEVKNFANNVKNYDLNWLDNEKLIKLVEELQNHTDELWDTMKVEEKIKKVKNMVWDHVDEVVDIIEPSAELADNPHYQKLQSEIDGEIKTLEQDKKRILDMWNHSSEEWSAKITQIENQIKKLNEFKNNIKRASIKEVETLSWMYSLLLKIRKWEWFFDNIDTITKLVSEESKELHESLNSFDWQKLRSVIKELQKNGKLTDVSDEALNYFIIIMEEIKIKKLVKTWETLVPTLKFFLKFVWMIP